MSVPDRRRPDRRQLARWVEAVTPPVLLPHARRLARRGRAAGPPEWEYVPEGWQRASADLRGWNEPSVVDAYRTKRDAFRAALDGTAPLAFPTSPALAIGEPNVADQNILLAFAHALLRSSWGKDRISVLDWGGGLGLSALVARAVLPATVELDYHCKDVPLLCEYGRDAVPDITFWDDDRCFDHRYDFVLASSALQYAEDWRATLAQLATAARDALFLTRVPMVIDHTSFVVLQRARGYRFESEYLSWVFNRGELLEAAAASGVDLVREFLLGYRPHVVGAPEQDETWAYLFRPARSPSA